MSRRTMFNKKNSRPHRIDPDFEKDMNEIKRIRFERGLADLKPMELSMREMTRLLRRTNGYKISLEELKNKPKKEKLKNGF